MKLNNALKSFSFIYVLLLICICITCSLFTYNKIFPITGGFYSVTAKAIEEGMLPYKDFQLLFPPLYTYIIFGLTQVFGYSFIAIRIFGIFIFCIEALLLFKIYNQIFDTNSSFFGSLLSVFMMQSGNAFTAYDYGRIHDVFVFLALLLFLKILIEKNNNKAFVLSFIMGICMGMTIALRQSSGVIVTVTFFLLFIATIIFMNNKKKRFFYCGSYCCGLAFFVAILILLLYINGMLNPFIQSTTTEALSAKGGLFQALFGWISEALTRMWNSKSYICLLSLWGILCFKFYNKDSEKGKTFYHIEIMVFCCLIICSMIYCYGKISSAYVFQKFYSHETPYILFFLMFISFLFLLLYFIINYIKNRTINFYIIKFLTIESIFIAISWGGAMSASLGFLTVFPSIGLWSALCLFLTKNTLKRILYWLNIFLNLFFCIVFFCNKIIAPYSWWGLNLESADQQIFDVDLPYMEGIKTSKSNKLFLEEITKMIIQNTDENDKIFAFPHMPVFYLFSNHMPFTYSYLQWFDVSSDSSLEKDMTTIEKEKPKIIIIEYLPDYVFQGHEDAFRNGNISQQKIMQQQLNDFVYTNNYTNVKTFYEENEYSIQIFIKDYEQHTDDSRNDNENIITVSPDISEYDIELNAPSVITFDINKEKLREVRVDGKKYVLTSTDEGYTSIFLNKGSHKIVVTFQEWDKELIVSLLATLLITICGVLLFIFDKLKIYPLLLSSLRKRLNTKDGKRKL